jgi:hypothetical protein
MDRRALIVRRLQGFVGSIKYANLGKQPIAGGLGTCSKFIYSIHT